LTPVPYQTLKRSTTFINSVSIPKRAARAGGRRAPAFTVPAAPVALQDKTAQAVVVGSGLIFAEDGVSKQVKEDLLTCTLFAQFAAQSKVGSAGKVVQWYEAYFDALRNLGWAMSSQDFREHVEKGKTVVVHKAIMTVLAAVLGPAATALVVVKSVFDGLEQVGENNGWLTFFDRQSVQAEVAKFQVVTAQPAKDGQINIGLVGFELRAETIVTQVLFFKSKKEEVRLRFAGGTATIFEPVLAGVRDTLNQKLKAVTASFVNSIPIPSE
jgi:hypothetical protein